MAAKDLELKVKVIAEEMEKHTASGKVSEKQANSFKATLSEFERLIGKASSPSDWLKIKSLVNKLGNTLLDVTSNLNEVSKEAAEYAKQLAKAEKAQEKVNDKIEKNVRGKGYQINEDLGKVTGLRKSAASGQDSWEKIFEEQQKTANAILGQNGKPLAWSTFQNKFKSGNLTEEQKEKVGIFEKQIEEHINKANQEYQKFRAELEQYKTELLRLQANPPQKGSNIAFDRALEQVNAAKQAAEGQYATSKPDGVEYGSPEDFNSLTNALNKQSTSFGKVFRQFSLYTVAIRTIRKALSEATKTIKEIDRALTEQAMVTGLTRKQTYGLLKDYQNMAARLGSTTKEVSSTMTEFLRQGRSITEATKLTEAAVSAAKVAGISAADSINYLTTAINGFRLSADDAMKVSDKFAAVAATAATSYEEIAVALSKVAAQANLAGMSIDYTTALLTKGIETTREAPETIGTALKTVIARMRELGDYGETLQGDIDINNVESQLAYIGIALRDNNGELRSTEDVLNDLGAQWDDLNANQQAAIAKALAGTRQQSRLIAMMSDYERVIELQEIAERSQGATMAQMATYMEGMDAALNKVNVAWEKIISTITNSDILIGIVDVFSNILELINNILSSTGGMITAITTISTIGITILGNKMRELELARLQREYTLEQNKLQNEENIARIREHILQIKNNQAANEAVLTGLKERKVILDKVKARIAEGKIAGKNMSYSEQWLRTEEKDYEKQLAQAEKTKQQLEEQLPLEEKRLEISEKQQTLLEGQTNILSRITTGFTGMIIPVTTILGLIKSFKAGMAAAKIYQDKINQGLDKQAAKQERNNTLAGKGMFAHIVSAFASLGPWSVAAGVALGVALAAAIGVGIAAASGAFDSNKSAEEVNKFSKKIYDLNKKYTSIDTAISKFDDLDNKIIKTKEDLQEMSDTLSAAADSLTEDEKKIYDALTTDRARKEYLETVRDNTNKELTAARHQQANKVIGLRNRGGSEWRKFLINTDTATTQAWDAVYALNNSTLYDYIDALKETTVWSDEAATATQHLTQAILKNLSKADSANLLDKPELIQKYVDTIAAVQSTYTNAEGNQVKNSAAAILDSDSNSIKERAEAFKALKKSIEALGDRDLTEAFITANNGWANLVDNFNDNAINYLDQIGATAKSINGFADAVQDLGYNSEEAAEKVNKLLQLLAQGVELGRAISEVFNYQLGTDNFNSVLNAFDKNFGTTILNMGQNIDKLNNSIDSFYKTATEWSTMSETDKTNFISENQEFFKGEQGQKLLDAFNSADFNMISIALARNDTLNKQRLRALEDVNRQLNIELARAEKDRNYVLIQELEKYKRQLEDTDHFYLASLKTRYEQQQNQLSMYKEFLQKETDELTKALEKRKEAYEKYFEEINQTAEDEDYDEKANLLIANISKLSSSTNADAIAKTADLQKQFEDLEKERLQTLRERAQEAVLQQMEDEVSKISDNLEKLLNNEQALLKAMLDDTKDSSQFIASLISAQVASGNTELGMQSYLANMQSTFASLMPGVDWSNVEVEQRGDTTILNIEGKEIVLSEREQQSIYDAIDEALKQIGKR